MAPLEALTDSLEPEGTFGPRASALRLKGSAIWRKVSSFLHRGPSNLRSYKREGKFGVPTGAVVFRKWPSSHPAVRMLEKVAFNDRPSGSLAQVPAYIPPPVQFTQ